MIKQIGVLEAIIAINPEAQVNVYGPDDIEWNRGTPEISKVDIDAKIVELEAEWTAQEYARNRANEYPSIQNVTVALAEKTEGRSAMWDEITALRLDVKSKYPKT